jgi:uncharacterized protein (TIGR04551 family)
MRRHLFLRSFLALVAPVVSQVFALQAAQAQDAGVAPATDAAAAADAAAPDAEPAEEPAPPASEGAATAPSASPLLEPPALTPLELDPKTGTSGAEVKPKTAAPAEKRGWTAPETVFHMHGYLRMRGTLLKDGALGHRPDFDRPRVTVLEGQERFNTNYDPFPYFLPEDSSNYDPDTGTMRPPVEGGCGKAFREDGRCDKKTQVGGDMRLRLKPEIHLSDDVRIKAWVDILDNVGLGTLGYGPNSMYGPDNPELGNLIRVRRAWGEARNRDIGELRFGRMGADWGLGILDNGGDRNGIDSDFSSDLDRIMGITNLAGFYLTAAYDWASQGKVTPGSATPSGVPVDRAQRDDLSALTIAAAHKLEPELQRSNLLRGEAVYNYGLYFIYRRQRLKDRRTANTNTNDTEQPYYRYDQSQFVPDLWFQFLWEGLRIEIEAAFVAGSLQGGCPWLDVNPDDRASWRSGEERTIAGTGALDRETSGECKFRQLGAALESEYRLFDDRLGIHFLSGFASGDANAYGLAQTNDPSLQRSPNSDADRTISTYQFHPDYRVDLILWRTLMRRVAGGYYFKPGVSYDFIHDPYGQQAGARVDVIYSRAVAAKQTWGNDTNLGLELDLSLYYRSEDGPDVLDGFYTTIQWGILFPFQGLKYVDAIMAPGGKTNAMILRGVMGIAF